MLDNFTRMDQQLQGLQHIDNYKAHLQQKAEKLARSVVDSKNVAEQIEAAHAFVEAARANNSAWKKIGKLVLGIVGTVLILGICVGAPVTALIALKVLSGGGLLSMLTTSGILPTLTSMLAPAAGKVFIGAGVAFSLYPITKFYDWMVQPTPVQVAAKAITKTVDELERRFKP